MRISPTQQTFWDWRAAMNFILGGTGSGLIFIAALAASLGRADTLSILLGAVLVTVGLVCVWFEIGRPERFLNVLRNPYTSWMSREAWVAVVLIPFCLAAALLDLSVFSVMLAIPAFGFLYCQARILCAACGVPSWRRRETCWLIVTTGLTEGVALYLMLMSHDLAIEEGEAGIILVYALGLLGGRTLAWWRWRNALEREGPHSSFHVMQRFEALFLLAGHVLPFLMLSAAWMAPNLATTLTFVACVPIFAAGWVAKYLLITRAAHTQGFALERTPARGGGRPGAGIRPGWSGP